VIAEGSVSGLGVFDIYIAPTIQVPESGLLRVVVDWTFPSNDVDVHLARGACGVLDFLFGACNLVAGSTSVTVKPEHISASASAAGSYTLIIPNFGPGRESIAYQVVLTTGGGASTASQADVSPSPEKLEALRAAADH
jgi:hypothetical protein